MAECVKNSWNEFEKALGLDMVWLASEMSRPRVGMMTEEEYENIKTPRLLTEAEKRGAIVDALVRTLELDTNGRNLALFLQILEKKPQQYRKAISMLKGSQANPPPQQAYQPAPGDNALQGYYQNFGPPQPPGGYQPGQQPQYEQLDPPQQYGFPPQQQGGYHQGANVSNPGGLNKVLTTKDLASVTKYLRELSNHEIIKIGVELGLDFIKLKRIKLESLMDDMVLAWLRKDDCVGEKSGDPSWQTLCTALKECGHTGIADKVKAEGGQANPPLQQAYQPASGGNALQGYYPHFGPPQQPGEYQPSSYGQQQPQHQQPNPLQQYGFPPQQQGWYYLGPPQNGHYPQAQNYGANVPNGSSRAPNPGAAAVPGHGFQCHPPHQP